MVWLDWAAVWDGCGVWGGVGRVVAACGSRPAAAAGPAPPACLHPPHRRPPRPPGAQALLFLFNGAIKGDIEGAVHDALLRDVPQAVNDVMGTLPAQVGGRLHDARGLWPWAPGGLGACGPGRLGGWAPVALWPCGPVALWACGPVGLWACGACGPVRRRPLWRARSARCCATGARRCTALGAAPTRPRRLPSPACPPPAPTQLVIQGLPFHTVFTYALYTLNYVLVKGYGQVEAAPEGGAASGTAAAGSETADLVACPFPVSPLSLPAAQLSGEPHMASLYLHHNVLNCILWGLFHGGAMSMSVRDGNVPGVRLVGRPLLHRRHTPVCPATPPPPPAPAPLDMHLHLPPPAASTAPAPAGGRPVWPAGARAAQALQGQRAAAGPGGAGAAAGRLLCRGRRGGAGGLLDHNQGAGRGGRRAGPAGAGVCGGLWVVAWAGAVLGRCWGWGRCTCAEQAAYVPVWGWGGRGRCRLSSCSLPLAASSPSAPRAQVAVLHANLSLAADLDWGATSIRSVEASYEVAEAGTPISLKGWGQMMVWVVQTFGAKVTLQQLMEQYVQTPASPFVQLVRGHAAGPALPAARAASRCCCLARRPRAGSRGLPRAARPCRPPHPPTDPPSTPATKQPPRPPRPRPAAGQHQGRHLRQLVRRVNRPGAGQAARPGAGAGAGAGAGRQQQRGGAAGRAGRSARGDAAVGGGGGRQQGGAVSGAAAAPAAWCVCREGGCTGAVFWREIVQQCVGVWVLYSSTRRRGRRRGRPPDGCVACGEIGGGGGGALRAAVPLAAAARGLEAAPRSGLLAERMGGRRRSSPCWCRRRAGRPASSIAAPPYMATGRKLGVLPASRYAPREHAC
jgi:hypothetical protein